MFSGIVQGTGKISKIISKKNHITLEVSAPKNFNKNLKKGASVSVNGICLTSLDNGKKNLKFDVINETLSKTNIGKARKGSLVNLERSITASTEIGGHLMSGHVHFAGKIEKIITKNTNKDIQIKFPKKYKIYLQSKSFVFINQFPLT